MMRCSPAILLTGILAFATLENGAIAADPIDIGPRRELLVDDFMIEKLDGTRLELHRPMPRDVAIVHDRPWEGSGSGYHSVFRDGDLLRMYYKAWQLTVHEGKLIQPHPLFACYAESRDGIHWEKPELGLVEFNGSTKNNILLAPGRIGNVDADPGHIAVFKDDFPSCPPEARYKAIVRSRGPNGLLPFKSADGLRWFPMSDGPVITEGPSILRIWRFGILCAASTASISATSPRVAATSSPPRRRISESGPIRRR